MWKSNMLVRFVASQYDTEKLDLGYGEIWKSNILVTFVASQYDTENLDLGY